MFLDDLKGELDEYVQKHLPGRIKVIRNTKREGLIRGRMIGAAHATGTAVLWIFFVVSDAEGGSPQPLTDRLNTLIV